MKAIDERRVETIRRHEALLKSIDENRAEAIRRHDSDLKAIDERQALRVTEKRETLLTIRVPIHAGDLETVAAMLYVMGGEEPVKVKGVPALYSVKCRPEEATELRAQIEALYAQRINVAAIREECLKRLPGVKPNHNSHNMGRKTTHPGETVKLQVARFRINGAYTLPAFFTMVDVTFPHLEPWDD